MALAGLSTKPVWSEAEGRRNARPQPCGFRMVQMDNPAKIPPYPYVVLHEATEPEIIIHAMRHQARNPSGIPGAA